MQLCPRPICLKPLFNEASPFVAVSQYVFQNTPIIQSLARLRLEHLKVVATVATATNDGRKIPIGIGCDTENLFQRQVVVVCKYLLEFLERLSKTADTFCGDLIH